MKNAKICRACEREKPLSDFKKLSPLMVKRSGTGLTHGHDCLACRLEARARRKAEKAAKEGDTPPLEQNDNPKLSVPFSMAVEIEYDGADFVLTQENEGVTHTVYMAPHAVRRLLEFADELAHKHAGSASA